jgi:hypothetical protein
VLDAIEERLREDLGDEDVSALTRKADPVLAELWDTRSVRTPAHQLRPSRSGMESGDTELDLRGQARDGTRVKRQHD